MADTWKTYRVVVEVPVLGPCTDAAVVSVVKDRLRRVGTEDFNYYAKEVGKVRVKSLARVSAAARRKER